MLCSTVNEPWPVSIRIRASTRSGAPSVSTWAIIPPIEWPSSTNRSQPSASASANRSAAKRSKS